MGKDKQQKRIYLTDNAGQTSSLFQVLGKDEQKNTLFFTLSTGSDIPPYMVYPPTKDSNRAPCDY